MKFQQEGIFKWDLTFVAFSEAQKYNIRRNVNSDLSIVTMRKVAITFFEFGVVKNFMQKF